MSRADFWRGKRVFLTGNTGFKGSWLSLWLSGLGARVTGYSLPPPTDPSLFAQAGLARAVEWTEGDVRDAERLGYALAESRADVVFHLAAQPLVRRAYADPVGTFATNVMGTVNLLEALRSCPSARAAVVVTTDKCYENREWCWGYREDEAMGGHDPYSASKGCAELAASAYRRSFFSAGGAAIATARAGNVIGGGDYAEDRLIPDFLRSLGEGKRITLRNPGSIRPWQHVLEPLSGYLDLAEALWNGGSSFAEAWNFGPDDSDARTVEWIVKELCGIYGIEPGHDLTGDAQPHEANYLKLDISKAKARLGWAPRWNLRATLERIVEWDRAPPAEKRRITEAQIRDYESCGERSR